MNRYSRQTLFAPIGEAGQAALRRSRVCVIGCGALGSHQCESLTRAGVGEVIIIDRDFVEDSNLQRQTLFTEQDARERTPKAVAAVHRLRQINREVNLTPVVEDVTASNIERLIENADVVLDGTDNFTTRFLINDACVKNNISWIYGAGVGSLGATMTIPRTQESQSLRAPCLRCVFPDEPLAGTIDTCDTAGIIAPLIAIVAAVQVTEAFKILTNNTDDLHNSLMQFDVWRNEWRKIKLGAADVECRTCGLRRFDALDIEHAETAATLCGRNAVQIRPSRRSELDFNVLAARLRPFGDIKINEYLLRLTLDEYELTIFKDARAIIRGTDDLTAARALYARFIGN